ncbi:MAG: hypothetical protein U5R30_12750 [Deltaproteobacteria bacterium]|nr:hypothetical protein [Deltaproteobacteria bacterium]
MKSRPINEGGQTLENDARIDVVSFVLKDTRFGDELVEATEERRRRELIAEAENYAADGKQAASATSTPPTSKASSRCRGPLDERTAPPTSPSLNS